MITIRLKGGMGNQMFQYALGIQLSTLLQTNLQLDLSSLLDRSKGPDFVYRNYDLDIFKLRTNFVTSPDLLAKMASFKSARLTRWMRKKAEKGKILVKEKHFHFQPEIIAAPQNDAIYEGWFQSPLYFNKVQKQVKTAFTFEDAILPASKEIFDNINNSNAVCLNVRRTDFLKVDTLNATNQAYFDRAAKRMGEQVDQPVFFIFSDDMEWCREHIKPGFPTHYIGHEHKGRKFGNYLQLMKACQHFIIPNSSFAWWAVYLNEHDKKQVIAPKNWFTDDSIHTEDLIPDGWIRI